MPNTPLVLGKGASALVRNGAATEEQLAAVRHLFDQMGVTAVFEQEDMLNEIIPYNGSAPAYVYAFADAMVQSAAAHGVPADDALRLFCQTCIIPLRMNGILPESIANQGTALIQHFPFRRFALFLKKGLRSRKSYRYLQIILLLFLIQYLQ